MSNMIRFPYNNFRAKPAIASRAQVAKKIAKNQPIVVPELRRQEGSAVLSALLSVSLATLGAFLGTAIQFQILEDIIAREQGIDKVSYLEFMSRPEATSDYLSIAAAGFVGVLIGGGLGIGLGSIAPNKENNLG